MITTASGLARTMHCYGPLKLRWIERTDELTDKGHARHRYLQRVGEVGAAAAIAEVPEEYREVCEAIPVDKLPTNLGLEVAFCLDLATGEGWELGRAIERKYDKAARPPTALSICGTADVVGIVVLASGRRRALVLDYKSIGDKTPARSSLQLRFLALVVARAYECDEVVVERDRIRDDGEVYRDQWTYTDLQLDSFFMDLRRRFIGADALLLESRGVLHEGPWCARCPSFVFCPAKTALAHRLAAGTEVAELELMKPLDRKLGGLAWMRVREAESMLKRIKSACFAALAEHGELELPDGRILKHVLAEGNEELDGRVVYHVAEELHGRHVADKAVEIYASKKALDEALKAEAQAGRLPPRGRSKAREKLLDTVRDRGGARKPMRKRLAIIDPATPDAKPEITEGDEG